MSAARELFKYIQENQLEAIEGFLRDKKHEDGFLDYKQTNGANVGKHTEEDLDKLAKNISAFGNTDGGVIVWGIKCDKSKDGDVPTKKRPIAKPEEFASRLAGLVSQLTEPPHMGIQMAVVDDDRAGEGYVATLIPKSDYVPLRALRGYDRYYIRAGSNTVRMPHGILETMFGKRPIPVIEPSFELRWPAADDGPTLIYSANFLLSNIGIRIARDLYITARVKSSMGANSRLDLKRVHKYWPRMGYSETHQSLASSPEFLLPPGDRVEVAHLVLHLQPPFERDLEVEVSYGCDGSAIRSFTFSLLPTFVARLLEVVINMPLDNVDTRCGTAISTKWPLKRAADHRGEVFASLPDGQLLLLNEGNK